MAIKLSFFLPHASVGKAYAQAVQLINQQANVVIAAIDIDPATGLIFDESSQQLIGNPLVAGDYSATIYYQQQYHDGQLSTIKTETCALLINPDPRSLWKNIPSDQQQLYSKADAASQVISSPKIKMLAASQRGRSHAHKGQARDDDFYMAAGENWQLAIVADGAGSAKYSRYGAYLLCQLVGADLRETLTEKRVFEVLALKKALTNILKNALAAVHQEATQQQADLRDYASTLLVVIRYYDVSGQWMCLSYSVGDGVMALYQPTKKVQVLNAADSGEFAGQTRFFNDETVTDEALVTRINVHSSHYEDILLLMSDGISDPFFETDNQLKKLSCWDVLWQDLQQKQVLLDEKNLLNWLDFWSAGNHDDRTIIVVLGLDESGES